MDRWTDRRMDAIALPDSQMQSQLCEFQTETQNLGLDFPKSETRFWARAPEFAISTPENLRCTNFAELAGA